MGLECMPCARLAPRGCCCRISSEPLGSMGCARGNCLQWLPLAPTVLLHSWAGKKGLQLRRKSELMEAVCSSGFAFRSPGGCWSVWGFNLLLCSGISLGGRGQHSWRQHWLNLSPSAWKGPDWCFSESSVVLGEP